MALSTNSETLRGFLVNEVKPSVGSDDLWNQDAKSFELFSEVKVPRRNSTQGFIVGQQKYDLNRRGM